MSWGIVEEVTSVQNQILVIKNIIYLAEPPYEWEVNKRGRQTVTSS